MSRSGAERISAHRNNHGFWRSGLSVLICCHGLERISRECHGADRSRYPLVEKVTDYHGADIRPLEMSRIGADWAIRSVIIRITDYISIRTVGTACCTRGSVRHIILPVLAVFGPSVLVLVILPVRPVFRTPHTRVLQYSQHQQYPEYRTP